MKLCLGGGTNQRPRTAAVVTVRPQSGIPSACDAQTSRQRPGIGRQLTWITTSPASASISHIANTSGASRRSRARRPWGPTQVVLRACVLPNTRTVRRASRAAPRTGLRIICDFV
ncbi:hypothetical protein EVAR_79326_1 [Eumeta japonica]|uniref:Uncharacterized protein n=1 Tax=Eumeta variegata TaxID=151549 RepID=A0A4C1TEU4_EUMVA|nr:hypothetical protein EVAR_79326_1 [Eumeta japonica]